MEASLEKLLAGLEQAGWKNDRVNSNIPTLVAISLALVNLCNLPQLNKAHDISVVIWWMETVELYTWQMSMTKLPSSHTKWYDLDSGLGILII